MHTIYTENSDLLKYAKDTYNSDFFAKISFIRMGELLALALLLKKKGKKIKAEIYSK